MNCIIIEDYEVSRKLVEVFVEKTKILNLVASYATAVEAINDKLTKKVDLVFLDIELPEMSGIEYLKTLDYTPQIIIMSAQDKYALEAFEYDVSDYLLKPITYSRFYKAVSRTYLRWKKDQNVQKSKNEIFLKHESSLIKVRFEEILWVEALENYVVVNTYHEKYTIHFTMKAILKKLPLEIFRQVHRSYIVNIDQIELIQDNAIIIKTAEETKNIPIGKSYKDNLMNSLNLMSK